MGAIMTITREDHITRIRDLSQCLNNEDYLGMETEADNLVSGKPAYWYRGRTSAAMWVVWGSRTDEANHSFLKALETFVSRKPTIDVVGDILDNVIPLNDAAVAELQLCYRLQSTFCDDLKDRERQAIFDPEFFPRMGAATRAVWAVLYEQCQRRWAERYHATLKDAQSPVLDLVKAAVAVSSDDDARVVVEGEPVSEVA